MIFSNTSWISILQVLRLIRNMVRNWVILSSGSDKGKLMSFVETLSRSLQKHWQSLVAEQGSTCSGLDPWARLKISDEDDGHLAPKKRDIHHATPSSPVSPLTY